MVCTGDSAIIEAKLTGRRAWQIAALDPPRALLTTFTCGADTPERMAATARTYVGARAIKLKLTGDAIDADRVHAVREACPDKCGGLTEALAMARRARELGLEAMVGNMLGTSLAMAPAYLVGQLCRVVDLDGPLFLAADRSQTVRYENGMIVCTPSLWG